MSNVSGVVAGFNGFPAVGKIGFHGLLVACNFSLE